MPLGIVNNEDFESEIKNSGTNFTVPTVNKTNESEKIPHPMTIIQQNENGPITTSDVLIKRFHPHGRNEGDMNVPDSLRKLIGETGVMEGRPAALELAKGLGISPSSVSSYTNPATSPHLSEASKDSITTFLVGRKQKLSKKALNKLALAMNFIDEDKLKDLGARDLSAVAKDMAQVAKHMEPPKEEETKKDPVQFHFYAPQVRQENHYETVVAKDSY